MKTTASILVSLLAAGALANPIQRRADICNQAPAGTLASPPKPLATPSADTAVVCQQQCEDDSSCESFCFGLPPAASVPTCLLFAVPAAQVPSQGTDINVFDKACTSVPTEAPTHDNPIGTTPAGSGSPQGANGPSGTGASRVQPKGIDGEVAKLAPAKRNICGAAPSGPSANPPSPLQTRTDVLTAPACLALCKGTSGCESCEFGKPSATGPLECLLFAVPAASLPPLGDGPTFVAYDTAC